MGSFIWVIEFGDPRVNFMELSQTYWVYTRVYTQTSGGKSRLIHHLSNSSEKRRTKRRVIQKIPCCCHNIRVGEYTGKKRSIKASTTLRIISRGLVSSHLICCRLTRKELSVILSKTRQRGNNEIEIDNVSHSSAHLRARRKGRG
jgi:hypothetical protein